MALSRSMENHHCNTTGINGDTNQTQKQQNTLTKDNPNNPNNHSECKLILAIHVMELPLGQLRQAFPLEL
jgi:hypothetical protein